MIGSKIRELRKARKLSQEDLAEKISEISGESISCQSLSGWETGTVQPRTANLQAAAQAPALSSPSLWRIARRIAGAGACRDRD